jgi:hypothetical protein
MSVLIVLFNLKDQHQRKAYEEWARKTDLPTVTALPSVDTFKVHRVAGLFGSDEAAPYQYVEMININSLEQFGADVATDTMAAVASEFREFADNPVFMLSNDIEVN